MLTKNIPVQIEKAASAGFDGTWAISSDATDRVGDVISSTALKSQAGREVICLWQHDSTQPVGKWTNLRMAGTKLVADLKLADTNLGKMIKALLDVGTPLGASIGFRGQGKPREKGGVLFTAIELLETSIVSVPCNPEAMQIAKSFGLASVIESAPDAAQSGNSPNETIQRAKAATLAANRALRK